MTTSMRFKVVTTMNRFDKLESELRWAKRTIEGLKHELKAVNKFIEVHEKQQLGEREAQNTGLPENIAVGWKTVGEIVKESTDE